MAVFSRGRTICSRSRERGRLYGCPSPSSGQAIRSRAGRGSRRRLCRAPATSACGLVSAKLFGRTRLRSSGGHEHTLEILRGEAVPYLLVSGAGYYGHHAPTKWREQTLDKEAASRFLRLDVLRDGRLRLGVLMVDAEARVSRSISMPSDGVGHLRGGLLALAGFVHRRERLRVAEIDPSDPARRFVSKVNIYCFEFVR